MLGHSIASNAVTNILSSGDINVLEEYLGFAWKCINVRAEALATERLYVERLVKNKWVEDPNHEFNKVLQGDDDQYDLFEFLVAHQVSLDLYGESFWYFSKGDKTGRPLGRYLLDPNFITVYVANGRVTGYVYMKDGENMVLDVDEVTHYAIYDPNPWRQFRGKGPMFAAGWFVKADRYSNTFVNNFLENNAIPAGVVVAKGQVDNDDWNLFKQQWSDKFSGVKNAGKTGFIRGSDMEFVKTGVSLGEADFSTIKKSSRDDVLAMFGVPGPLLGIYENSNRASAVTAKGMFATTFTETALNRLSSKLTRKIQAFYGPTYRINHSNPVPEDVDQQLALYTAGTNKWITVDEARAAYGLDPLPNGAGRRLYLDDTLTPLDQIGKTAPADNAEKKKLVGTIVIRTKDAPKGLTNDQKETFRKATEENQLEHERKFLEATEKILKEQKKSVLEQLTPKKIVDTNFDAQQQATLMVEELMPILVQMAKVQGSLAYFLIDGSTEPDFTVSPVMEQYIRESIAKACQNFTEETQTRVAEALTDGLNSGESLKEISSRISSIYDDVLGIDTPGYRIDRLARTEIIKASNAINLAVYKDAGVTKMEWFANPGACEYCQELNGSVISTSTAFVPQGQTMTGVDGGSRVNDYETIDHPPAHPNCRCTIIPVIDSISVEGD